MLSSCRGRAQPQGAEAGWAGGSPARTNRQFLFPSQLRVACSKGGCQGLQPRNGAAAFSWQKDGLSSAEKFMSNKPLVLGWLGHPWARGNAAGAGKDGWRLHSEVQDGLCSTTEGCAVRHFSDGATLSFPEGANPILCKQNRPPGCPLKAICLFYSKELQRGTRGGQQGHALCPG